MNKRLGIVIYQLCLKIFLNDIYNLYGLSNLNSQRKDDQIQYFNNQQTSFLFKYKYLGSDIISKRLFACVASQDWSLRRAPTLLANTP